MGSKKSSAPAPVEAPPEPKEVIVTGNEANSRTKYPAPTPMATAEDEESNVRKKSGLRSEKTSTGLNVG